MRRACPYRGENPGPGKDVHGELDHRPGIREQPGSLTEVGRIQGHVCLDLKSGLTSDIPQRQRSAIIGSRSPAIHLTVIVIFFEMRGGLNG